MTEAEKAYQYFVIAVPENEEQAKAYFYARKALQSTLTPQNGCVSRLRELDELYTKLHAVTGFTVEQLLEMFAAGYTLEKHDYSKSFEEMASLLEYEKEHANAYYEECGQWEAENEKLRVELNRCREKNAGLALALLTECAPNPDCLGDDEWRAIKTELEQVKQERDAAIDCIYKIMEEENK